MNASSLVDEHGAPLPTAHPAAHTHHQQGHQALAVAPPASSAAIHSSSLHQPPTVPASTAASTEEAVWHHSHTPQGAGPVNAAGYFSAPSDSGSAVVGFGPSVQESATTAGSTPPHSYQSFGQLPPQLPLAGPSWMGESQPFLQGGMSSPQRLPVMPSGVAGFVLQSLADDLPALAPMIRQRCDYACHLYMLLASSPHGAAIAGNHDPAATMMTLTMASRMMQQLPSRPAATGHGPNPAAMFAPPSPPAAGLGSYASAMHAAGMGRSGSGYLSGYVGVGVGVPSGVPQFPAATDPGVSVASSQNTTPLASRNSRSSSQVPLSTIRTPGAIGTPPPQPPAGVSPAFRAAGTVVSGSPAWAPSGSNTTPQQLQAEHEVCAVHGNLRSRKHLQTNPMTRQRECIPGFHCLEGATPTKSPAAAMAPAGHHFGTVPTTTSSVGTQQQYHDKEVKDDEDDEELSEADVVRLQNLLTTVREQQDDI